MRLAWTWTAITILAMGVGCGGDGGPPLAEAPDQRPNDSTDNANGDGDDQRRRANADQSAATRRLSDAPRQGRGGQRGGGRDVVAMLDDRPVRWAELRDLMIESAGASALGEWVMDKQIDAALREASLTLSEDDIERERDVLLDRLSDDPDEATRLLDEVREDRGLGPERFRLLLRRNAGLRKLVADRVEVTEAMVEQLYAQRYGERTEARLILVETVGEASDARQRLADGEAFIDLAVELSIDRSADRGGLLPHISVDDPTFPEAIREAVDALEPGDVSEPIAVERGYAILQAERKIPADEDVSYADVADELRQDVRLRNERAAMQERARLMLQDADLNIMDNDLDRAWRRRQRDVLQQR